MSDNNNFNGRIDRRRRVTRIRNTILLIVVLWFFTSIAATAYLLVEVISIRHQITELKGEDESSKASEADDSEKKKSGKEKKDKSSDSKSAIAAATEEDPDTAGEVASSSENKERAESYEENAKEMEKLESDARSEGKTKIYLTFSDAPSDQTGDILDILKSNDIKATFFCNGEKDKKAQKIYRRIADEGHTLGISTNSRDLESVFSSVESFQDDFAGIRENIQEFTGIEPSFYRFPNGSGDTSFDVPMQELCEYIRDEGMEYVDWNCDTAEAAEEDLSTEEMAGNTVARIFENESAILLLRESDDQTKEVLPEIIEAIKAADSNAAFFPVTEGTDRCHHLVLPGEA